MTDPRDEGRFIERVAGVLREPEMLDVEFERRVMALVRDEGRPWWARARTLTVTPARALALAAAFGGIMVLGALGLSRGLGTPAPAVAAAAADTVFVVRFVLAAPDAQRVSLVGDFNGWARDATILQPSGEAGVWSVSVPLAPGRHEYAFVIDGERWVADPAALRQRDEFGTESSIIRVGEVARGA